VRLNAEDPLHGFKPSPGVLKEVYFPICDEGVRIDTGVETSSEVSVFYDSLIAKVIVWAETRDKALKKMHSVLIETSLLGINHNLSYVTDIISSDNFMHMNLSTKFLDTFHFVPAVIEVIEGGAYTTVQDFPGRIGYWAEGVPPSGPMDDFSFRLANRLVGNDVTAAGLECTVVGPTLFFHQDSIVAIVGGKVNADISGSIFPMNAPVLVQAGQTLTMGKVVNGVRCYLAVFGGISTQTYLGSRSTFVLGKFAGLHGDGSVIKAGDMLTVPKMAGTLSTAGLPSLSPYFTSTSFPSLVEVGVLYGPHGAPDFFQTDSMTQFFSTDYEVHYNASRLGVRLVGPKPSWARANGGEAGLHPSNIHDTEYTVGSINFTGDFPVILTCDGPSLGKLRYSLYHLCSPEVMRLYACRWICVSCCDR
jgi:urea carboxylase